MTLDIRPTGAAVGAIVTGLDMEAITPAETAALRQAFLDFGVLVFKGAHVETQGQLALSEIFGELDVHPIESIRHKDDPRLIELAANGGKPVAADDPDADKIVGKIPWHADLMYTDTPNRGGILRALVVPAEGGFTGWIDTSRLYATLPRDVKERIQGLRIVHSYARAYGVQSMVGTDTDLFPEVSHPLVYVHPENDRAVLNISPSSSVRIEGLPEEEARELLDWLCAFATREEEAYVHQWQEGDMVLWDNWRTIHSALGHKKRYPRVVQRTTLKSNLRTGRYLSEPKMKAVA